MKHLVIETYRKHAKFWHGFCLESLNVDRWYIDCLMLYQVGTYFYDW